MEAVSLLSTERQGAEDLAFWNWLSPHVALKGIHHGNHFLCPHNVACKEEDPCAFPSKPGFPSSHCIRFGEKENQTRFKNHR